MIVRILQATLYPTLKGLIKVIFFFFYRKTTIIHPERLDFKGPTILVSNHPNTLLDPLNVAVRMKRRSFFLANAGLFNSAFGNWFFNTFYCIPIERPKDVNGKRIQNDESFTRCNEFLASGGCLYIAPQGGSEMVRRVGKIKTGTARIGLSAEKQEHFKLNLKIVAVGLNYSMPTDFREDVTLHVGEPIYFGDYQQLYEQDPFVAAKTITADLKKYMAELIIDTSDEKEDLLLRTLETIYQSDKNPDRKTAYLQAQQMLGQLRILKNEDKDLYTELINQAEQYHSLIKETRTSDAAIIRPNPSVNTLLNLFLGFPVFLFGWANNIIPAYLPFLAAKYAGLYIGYTATIKTILGIFTFPLFYGLQSWLLSSIGIPTWGIIFYLITLPFLGLYSWEYLQRWKAWRSQQRVKQLSKKDPKLYEKIKTLRDSLQTYTSLMKTYS